MFESSLTLFALTPAKFPPWAQWTGRSVPEFRMLEPRSGSSDQRAGTANVGLKPKTVSSAPRAGTANVSLKQKTCS